MVLTHQATIPYGAFLAFGGLLGFLLSGSVMSLLIGGGSGAALGAVGYMAKKDYEENKLQQQFKSATYSYCVVSLVIAVMVTLVMGERFLETGKFMPPGLVAVVSLGMVVFYTWKLSSDDVGTHAQRSKRYY